MARVFLQICLAVLCLAVAVPMSGAAATEQTQPPRVWRIAYVEGAPHPAFAQNLSALAVAMQEQGLIAKGDSPAELARDSAALWQWLVKNAGGTQLRFLPDGHYSADGSGSARSANKEALLRRIKERGDVDIILAMGGAAAKDMVNTEHSVPTFVLASTDPEKMQVDLSLDHVYVQLAPFREQRQVRLFHQMFQFRRMGIMYEDSPEGQALVGLQRIEKAAEELNVALVRCTLDPLAKDKAQQMRLCIQRLSQEADAVYLTYAAEAQGLPMKEVLAPLLHKGLPTFSQNGPQETRQGVLMSFSQQNYEQNARIAAEALQKVMAGHVPQGLSTLLNPRLGLSINLRTAKLIDWDIPLPALVAVDEIYDSFTTPHPTSANTAW